MMCGVIFILNYFLDPIIAAGVDELYNQIINVDNIESDIMMTTSGIICNSTYLCF